MVESEKNPGRQDTEDSEEDNDIIPAKKRDKLALVMTNRSAKLTNYTLVCSPQVLIREVNFS